MSPLRSRSGMWLCALGKASRSEILVLSGMGLCALGKAAGSEILVVSGFFGTGQRRGQQCPCRNHGSKQLLWKLWLQGSVATTSASVKGQRQMQHMSSELPSRILQQPLRSIGAAM